MMTVPTKPNIKFPISNNFYDSSLKSKVFFLRNNFSDIFKLLRINTYVAKWKTSKTNFSILMPLGESGLMVTLQSCSLT